MFQFFFGRSLQPRGIAETLCGSPLYMQLLQNIVKYSELHFPLDNNDLSADYKDLFFNHPFLSQNSRRSSRIIDGFPFSQEDCMSFPLDDDSSGVEGSPSFLRKRSSMKSTYGFSLDKKVDIRETIFNSPNNMDLASKYNSASHKPKLSALGLIWLIKIMFCIWTPMDVSSSSAITSKPSHSQCKSAVPSNILLESHSSAPFGTSQGSMDIGDALEQPSTHRMTRIKSLQQCASVITELLGGQLMLQVLRIMKNYARQLNAFGKWCMWIMRMMYFLLGMIPETYFQCLSTFLASEFVGRVRCIRILSPQVQQMSEEGMHLLNSKAIEGINDFVKMETLASSRAHHLSCNLGVHSLKPCLGNLVLKCKWL
ncbi:hypothetical protein AAG906_026371 [Vitis piasezkii]